MLTLDALYHWLLQQEASSDDDIRFYASYLLGHVSLLLGEAEPAESQLQQLNSSLDSAFVIDHLSDIDKQGIRQLLANACQARP